MKNEKQEQKKSKHVYICNIFLYYKCILNLAFNYSCFFKNIYIIMSYK